MSLITAQIEVSVGMTVDGIDLYIEDSDIPIDIYTFESLVKKFVESQKNFITDEEKEIFISNLEKMIATVKADL